MNTFGYIAKAIGPHDAAFSGSKHQQQIQLVRLEVDLFLILVSFASFDLHTQTTPHHS